MVYTGHNGWQECCVRYGNCVFVYTDRNRAEGRQNSRFLTLSPLPLILWNSLFVSLFICSRTRKEIDWQKVIKVWKSLGYWSLSKFFAFCILIKVRVKYWYRECRFLQPLMWDIVRGLWMYMFSTVGLQVSWIRRRDYHLLTVGSQAYSSDERFQVRYVKQDNFSQTQVTYWFPWVSFHIYSG